jgi:hypothetical protein
VLRRDRRWAFWSGEPWVEGHEWLMLCVLRMRQGHHIARETFVCVIHIFNRVDYLAFSVLERRTCIASVRCRRVAYER